jgi:hypothetical protein
MYALFLRHKLLSLGCLVHSMKKEVVFGESCFHPSRTETMRPDYN